MFRNPAINYIILKKGEKIEDVLDSLTNSTNVTPSTVRGSIDDWYRLNMTDYTKYLEDTIWCNDRSISKADAWNKDGNVVDLSDYKMNFSGYTRIAVNQEPSLVCKNKSDRFTVGKTKGNGKLTYPVALLTLDEATLAGYVWGSSSGNNYLNNDKIWWTMTPTIVSVSYVYMGVAYSILDNVHSGYTTNDSGGVRPSVSLKYGIKIKDGFGTVDDPFILKQI